MKLELDGVDSRVNERVSQLGFGDSAGYVDGPNLYEFVLDNPVDGVDPTGLWRQGPGNTIVVEPGDVPGRIARDLTGNWDDWQQVFPDLDDPGRLQLGKYDVDPNLLRQYRDRHNPPATRPNSPAQQKQTPPPATQTTKKSIRKRMVVTAYDARGQVSSSTPKNPCDAGPGTVATSDTSWRKTPGTPRGKGEYRTKRGAAVPAYPYGTKVKVFGPDGNVIYEGTITDTGRGWIRNGIPADQWLDIWLPNETDAIKFGKQTLDVEITPP